MQFKLIFKPLVTLLNKILTKNQKSDVSNYIDSITGKVENVKVFSDIFPDTNINMVVVLTDSNSIPETLIPFLSPNDNIVTNVIVGAKDKGITSILDIRQFVLEHYKDRINTLVHEIAFDLSGKLSSKLPLSAKQIEFIKSKISDVDLADIIYTAIKAKMSGVDFGKIVPDALKSKVDIIKSIVDTNELELVYQLLANVYGKKINSFVQTKFADNIGTIQIF